MSFTIVMNNILEDRHRFVCPFAENDLMEPENDE